MTTSTMTNDTQDTSAPLYLKGCKITAGARAGPPPPSYALAKMLVLARRASSRIIKPAAVTAIQKVYRAQRDKRIQKKQTACRTISKAMRSHLERKRRVLAIVKLQATARRLHTEKQYRALLSMMKPNVLMLQARARGTTARNQLRQAQASALSIQASWRMVRSRVVGQRLAGAALRLQAGAVLSKYKQGGLSHERHERFVWLSADRKKLCWAADAASAKGSHHTKQLDSSSGEASSKSVSMTKITAVSTGVKTTLMKKMEKRANAAQQTPSEFVRGARVRPLDADCAFSLIGSDRVLDFVARDEKARTQWLRDLRTLLVYAHHLDHEAAVGAIQAGVRRGSLAEPAAAAA